MSVEYFNRIQVLRNYTGSDLIVIQSLEHLSSPEFSEKVFVVFIHGLFMLSKLLHKLGCSFHYIEWRICEAADLYCFDVRLIQKLIVWGNLHLAIEMSRDN